MSFVVYNGDIADLWKNGHIVCVTVSLEVRHKDLSGIVDRGTAMALAPHVPKLAEKLGRYIMISKGEVGFVEDRIIAFFTKPRSCKFEYCLPDEVYRYIWGQKIPGGHCMADPVLVARSARQLLRFIAKERLSRVYLPVPGINNGKLTVEDIKEALDVIKESSVVRLVSNHPIDHPAIKMRDMPINI